MSLVETTYANESCKDIMKHVHELNILCWSCQKWEPISIFKPMFKFIQNNEQFSDLLLKHIKRSGLTQGENDDVTKTKILTILQEMKHNKQISYIRLFGIILSNLMRILYSKILINKQGIDIMGQKFKHTPVLLLPTHRSYVDFLLVSYLNFYYHLPIPIIAAGMDFKSMSLVGQMLKNAGAFFIRRSYASDRVYSTVLKKYFVECLVSGNSPIEFFLEGTRSRTGVSRFPKFGLLISAIETYLRKEVCDILVIPITIVYERLLEETLYAYELLGQPKPKESTLGLLKAARILKENFGDIYVKYSAPFSIRENFEDLVPESPCIDQYSITPKHRERTEQFAIKIINEHQKSAVAPLFSLVALVIQYKNSLGETVTLDHLLSVVLSLQNISRKFGIPFVSKANHEELKKALKVHENIINVKGDVVSLMTGEIDLPKSPVVKHIIPSAIMNNAIPHLILQIYINQVLYHYHLVSSIICSLCYCGDKGLDSVELQQKYGVCLSLIRCFLVTSSDEDEKAFQDLIYMLSFEGWLYQDDNEKWHLDRSNEVIDILCEAYSWLLVVINLVTDILLQESYTCEGISKDEIHDEYQSKVLSLLISGRTRQYALLSRQLSQDIVEYLLRNNGLTLNTSKNLYVINIPVVRDLKEKVSTIMKSPPTSSVKERSKL